MCSKCGHKVEYLCVLRDAIGSDPLVNKATSQRGNALQLPARALFAAGVVLALVIGLYMTLSLINSAAQTAQASNGDAGSEGFALELPIAERYARFYPNEARIATFLHEKGLDDIHIAAIIGVFKRESGNGDYDIDPAVVEYNLIGHGIAQWSYERWAGAHYGRPWQGLKYFALDRGRNWEDLDVQLDYLWGEMTGEGSAKDYTAVQYDHAAFMATTTLEEAVDFYLSQFMNCAGAQYDERLAFAHALYEKME